MDVVKDALAVFAGLIGVATAFLTLYAKYLDVKKETAGKETATPAASPDVRPFPSGPGFTIPEPAIDPRTVLAPPARDPLALERAKQAVRAPAILMIGIGALCLFTNLSMAVFGFVDEFVTPLTVESRAHRAMLEANQAGMPPLMAISTPGMVSGSRVNDPDEANVVLAIIAFLSLSMASVASIWGGISMLRLRGYWLSVAGCFAIMPASGFCCLGGAPIGVWSLVVLFKPEVADSFR